MNYSEKSRRSWPGWLLLLLLVAASLGIVLIPALVIQPFKSQTATGVEWSYLLRRLSPPITVIVCLLAVALAVWLWRIKPGWWRKGLLLVLCALTLLPAWFARQNHFEWMFNPLPNPAYARVSEASFVNDKDMVLSVVINNDAVAYPVRQMAYHHVVHDVVGGVPITATY